MRTKSRPAFTNLRKPERNFKDRQILKISFKILHNNVQNWYCCCDSIKYIFHLAFKMNKNIVPYLHQHDLYRVNIPHTMLRCLLLWFVLIRKCTCIDVGGVMWAMSDPVQHGVMLINPSTGNLTLNLYPLRPKASSKKLRENSIFFFYLTNNNRFRSIQSFSYRRSCIKRSGTLRD